MFSMTEKKQRVLESVQCHKWEEVQKNHYFYMCTCPTITHWEDKKTEKLKENPWNVQKQRVSTGISLECKLYQEVLAGRAPLETEVIWLTVLKWDHGVKQI